MSVDVAALARELDDARKANREVATLTDRHPELTSSDAYIVQALGLELRVADGETLVGGKLGFTSRAMQAAMGVDHPNYGWLTDAMVIHDGVVHLDRFIHPKVEPEIAFVLAGDLEPPVTAADVLAATSHVAACLEVVDSRFEGFRFRALDNIADDSSAAAFILGDPVSAHGLDLSLIGVVMSENGRVAHTGAGAAALDHPAAAVAWMANAAAEPLRAGHVVISGGLTAPVDLVPGTVITAEFDRLGTVSLRAV